MAFWNEIKILILNLDIFKRFFNFDRILAGKLGKLGKSAQLEFRKNSKVCTVPGCI